MIFLQPQGGLKTIFFWHVDIHKYKIKNIILKLDKNANGRQLKFEAMRNTQLLRGMADYKSVRVMVDVDPV